MVSKVQQIIAIQKEEDLVAEMTAFENAVEKRIEPIEALLNKDIKSSNEFTLEEHMAAVDSFRQTAVRIHALAACFLEHAKSPWFALQKSKETTEFDRNAKQKQLIAPFEGLVTRAEGLVKSIDSRVNMVKVLLRLTDDRLAGTR